MLRHGLINIGFAVVIASGLLYRVVILPGTSPDTENTVLVTPAVLCLLLPLVMIAFPRRWRPWIWVFGLKGLVMAARCGIGNGLAWFTGAAAVCGGAVGSLLLASKSTETGDRPENSSYAFSLAGFIAALVACFVLVLPCSWILSLAIAALLGLPTLSQGDARFLTTTLGLATALLPAVACHRYCRLGNTSWWKGVWLGVVAGAAVIGVMALCYH